MAASDDEFEQHSRKRKVARKKNQVVPVSSPLSKESAFRPTDPTYTTDFIDPTDLTEKKCFKQSKRQDIVEFLNHSQLGLSKSKVFDKA